jgi:hypothetical protein
MEREAPRLAFGLVLQGDQLGDRFAGTADDDDSTLSHSFEESGEVRFGVVDVYGISH